MRNYHVLAPLAAMASAIDGLIHKKSHGKCDVRVGKRITLLILNEDMNDIIRIIKSPENSLVLIDVVGETVKDELIKQEFGFLAML